MGWRRRRRRERRRRRRRGRRRPHPRRRRRRGRRRPPGRRRVRPGLPLLALRGDGVRLGGARFVRIRRDGRPRVCPDPPRGRVSVVCDPLSRAVPPDEGIGRAGAARPAAVRGARADVRGGCPLRGRVRGSEPLHLGVHVPPPRAARVGSAALVSGSASSVGAVSVEPSRCRGDLAARRAPRAPDRRNGSRGDTPNRDDGDRARARRHDARGAPRPHAPARPGAYCCAISRCYATLCECARPGSRRARS